MRDSTNTEIIICDKCNGKGYIECSELEDYHKGEYRTWNEECKQCHRNGRLIKTSKVTYVPYYDSEAIMELLKND